MSVKIFIAGVVTFAMSVIVPFIISLYAALNDNIAPGALAPLCYAIGLLLILISFCMVLIGVVVVASKDAKF